MAFQFLHEDNFKFICQGLTYDHNDYKLLDDTMIAFDAKTSLASLIVVHNQAKGFGIPFPYKGNQIQFQFDKFLHPQKGLLSTLTVGADAKSPGMTPMLFLNLHSPFLQIPQSVEIPLRFICQGLPSVKGHYMVYLHVVEINNDQKFVYYGITKRGWMKRFNEHVREAMKGNTTKLFASLLGRSIMNAADKLHSVNPSDFNDESVITGMHHVLIAVGRSLEEATQIETYLISKYSLKNPVGLNMLRGFKLE